MSKTLKATPLPGLTKLNDIALSHMNDKYATGYRFGDKDLIIDQITTLMEQTGATAADIAKQGLISKSTIYNWIKGKTRRPQNATIEAALRAMGLTREIVRFRLRGVR